MKLHRKLVEHYENPPDIIDDSEIKWIAFREAIKETIIDPLLLFIVGIPLVILLILMLLVLL